MDKFCSGTTLEIVVDQVDGPILEKFKERAKEFCDQSPTIHKVSGFDPERNEVVRSQYKVGLNIPNSLDLPFDQYPWEVLMDDENNPLTVVADVLANSLNHIFRSRKLADIGKPLNTNEAIARHPLASQFFGGDMPCISDSIFMHPSQQGHKSE
ncbi:hypothetical protein ACFL54_07740 [Planctomycetota bacterium]